MTLVSELHPVHQVILSVRVVAKTTLGPHPPTGVTQPPLARPELVSPKDTTNTETGVQSSMDPSEWGPMYDEEEDLRRAIQHSLHNTKKDDLGQATNSSARATGGHVTSHGPHGGTSKRNKDALVTGHHLSRSQTASNSQLVGLHHKTGYSRSDSLGSDHHSNHPVNKSHRLNKQSTTSRDHVSMVEMVEMAGPLFQDLPPPEDPPVLPSSIRQLLDTDDRLGTNV